MCDCEQLLQRAREELFHAKVVVRSTRNSTKTAAAALADSEQRMDGLIAEISAALNGSPAPKEGHGHARKAHLSQTH